MLHSKVCICHLSTFSVLFVKNNSCGCAPLGLKAEPILSKSLINLSLLYIACLPRSPNSLNPTPVPNTNPVKGIDSALNLNLFNIFLLASAFGSACTSLSNSVGPASNTSPIVPIFSTSPTKVSPAAPPKATAAMF